MDNLNNINSNEVEVLVRQLKRKVENLVNTTESKLLLHDSKIAEVVAYIKTNLDNTIRCMVADMEDSGEIDNLILNTIKKLTNSVKFYGAKGDGVSDDTFAIQDAINENKTIFLPEGTYIVSQELTIPDDVTLYGESERTSIIKCSNVKGNMKAVVRLSRSEVGNDSANAVSGVTLRNLTIDADGCDYGIYANYITNESKIENVTCINATKCNICILKSWFASFTNLTAKKGKNIGISLGIKQGNEIEVGINGVKFSNLRAHSNGVSDTHDQANNIERDAGIVIGQCNNCDFDNIQAELNNGIGIILKGYNTNHFKSMYLENNSIDQSNRYALYQTDQVTNGQVIEKLVLSNNQTILNKNKLIINNITRMDAIKTFYGDGTYYIDFMDYSVLSNQEDFSNVAYEWHEIHSVKNENIRYTSGLNGSFMNGNNVGYPFLVVLPKESLNSSTNLTILINGNAVNLGNTFVKDTPIFKRFTSLKNESHVNTILGSTGVSADLNADIMIGYFSYGTKKDSLPVKPF